MRKLLRKYPILGYYFNKLFTYFITIFGALTITFFMFRLIPTNPIQNWVKSLERQYSVKVEGGDAMINRYKEEFGLTGTLWEQYTRYMYQVIVKGDLGPSFIAFPTPVQDLLIKAIPWTVALLSVSIVISWVLGLLIGSAAAWFRESPISDAITNTSIALSQVPSYLIALFLVLFLGYQWKLLPTRGAFDGQYTIGWNWDFIKSVASHSILPVMAIVVVSLSGWILSTRSLVISNIGEDYLLYAEAKGLKPGKIMVGYALRNAMLPQATGLALTLGSMMSGQLLIENMFVYPGLGQVMGRAIAIFDYNTMMGIIILSVVSVMTASLIVDLLLPAIDPRIRTAIRA
ncbi:MAG TPA: ABC transporter permease [Anaerolineae bacterium]|nr:ABC transporter permease [Anaerolineae bacterium]HQI84300.1 ABC transporter permease [Anaerolineae bacterium]